MNTIISIKPKYVEKILNGSKTIEIRKRLPVNITQRMYIYSSSPTKRIVGYFTPFILNKTGLYYDELFDSYSDSIGITKEDLRFYLNHKKGYCIEIRNLVIYGNKIDPKSVDPSFHAPQSFCYTDADF